MKLHALLISHSEGVQAYRRCNKTTWRGRKMMLLTAIYFCPIIGKIAGIFKRSIYAKVMYKLYKDNFDKKWILSDLIDTLNYLTHEEFQKNEYFGKYIGDGGTFSIPDRTGRIWYFGTEGFHAQKTVLLTIYKEKDKNLDLTPDEERDMWAAYHNCRGRDKSAFTV